MYTQNYTHISLTKSTYNDAESLYYITIISLYQPPMVTWHLLPPGLVNI